MGKLINIDNGGTLTDFCAIDGDKTYRTKALTTPFDLSKCFFDGLKKLTREIYGDESKIDELLQSTDYIRYSTTQGTNALVERKGPRLGLLVEKGANLSKLQTTDAEASLFNDLIGDRVGEIDLSLDGDESEANIVKMVNKIVTLGANRVILSLDCENAKELEARINRTIGRKFPSHLLGVVPVLAASTLADDSSYGRRTWSTLMNSFLHPAMERFLYSADHRLSTYKTKNPLLIFRNDGGAARVAKTMAIKSYSSGPRGGMEGVREMAKHYGYSKILSYDVGGTTTDIGIVEDGVLASDAYGLVEGVEVSFPLCNIYSAGVGGSSIIAVNDGEITVGPESVGAAPGPACFGLGGKNATITDVFLLMGVLDPNTYFGGELNLDYARAKEAVMGNVGNPLGLSLDDTLEKMLNAWVGKIAASLKDYADICEDTTLSGFGGAGALAATRIADATGAKRVIIPGLGAVFSAAGIGFSPISQTYQVALNTHTDSALAELLASCKARATKDMFAEGVDISECEISATLNRVRGEQHETIPLNGNTTLPVVTTDEDELSITYEAKKVIQGMAFKTVGNESKHEPEIDGLRTINISGKEIKAPVICLEKQTPGATTAGPAIIEEAFFTGLVDEGWNLSVSGNQDLILEKIL